MNPEDKKILEDLQSRIDEVEILTMALKKGVLVDHFHNSIDSSGIQFVSVQQRKVWVHHTIVGTAAATAANYGVFFIAPFACIVMAVKEVHQTAGTDLGAVTLNIEKLTSGQANDGGVSIQSGTFNLKGTINTVQTGTVIGTYGSRTLAAGDRLSMLDGGTLTAVANVTIFVELQII